MRLVCCCCLSEVLCCCSRPVQAILAHCCEPRPGGVSSRYSYAATLQLLAIGSSGGQGFVAKARALRTKRRSVRAAAARRNDSFWCEVLQEPAPGKVNTQPSAAEKLDPGTEVALNCPL